MYQSKISGALVLAAPPKSHLLDVVKSLLATGWTIDTVPDNGKLSRNGQKMLLRSDRLDLRIRLFVYKVTGSGRSRPEERRIEITSTYQKGLSRLKNFPDVVIGYDYEKKLYVGVDAQRIEHGGRTGNASSFFDKDGLNMGERGTISVRQRRAALFPRGIEYHAFLRPERIAEYFFNVDEIHSGIYAGDGPYSGRPRKMRKSPSLRTEDASVGGDILVLNGPKVLKKNDNTGLYGDVLKALEEGTMPRNRRKITPEDFIRLKRVMEENGLLGEEYVLKIERTRLKRAGRPDLAEEVKWVSQESVSEGYDIASFEANGQPRFVEVKATSGNQRSFEMSDNEWQRACQLGERYYICRVTLVRERPSHVYIRNPKKLELEGQVSKTATGWRVSWR